MTRLPLACLAGLLMTLATGAVAPGQQAKGPTEEELAAADARAREYLKKLGATDQVRLVPIADESVARLFPRFTCVAVLFPQYPLARIAPEPLKSSNIIAVPKGEGRPQPLSDAKELETFFKDNAPAVSSGTDTELVRAWLRLAQELSQDGFYKFKEPSEFKAEGTKSDDGKSERILKVGGKVEVDPQGGNKGEIRATIEFDKDGKVTKIDHKTDLKPGPRPICQATKLLDPDPIVRRMAEDSIRVMGSAARSYLDEQRAKASPELQKAIDQIWQRIVDEGR
jgi:hypothetical protein